MFYEFEFHILYRRQNLQYQPLEALKLSDLLNFLA
jgi:hypothetical protein